jgi:endoglucanase
MVSRLAPLGPLVKLVALVAALLALAGAVVVALVVLLGRGGGVDPEAPAAPGQRGVPALVVEVDGGLTTEPVVPVRVVPPPGAVEMQVGADASFRTVPWRAVKEAVQVELVDTGYQMLFARFRGPGGPVGEVLVTGVLYDPTWEAATAAGGGGPHRASSVGLLRPDVVAVRIETGRAVSRGAADPPLELGAALDVGLLDRPASWVVSSEDDATFAPGVVPLEVHRISRPFGNALLEDLSGPFPLVHDYALVLPRPLRQGATYTVEVAGGAVEPLTYRPDDRRDRSPAVNANQVGYRPGDRPKLGFLSAWTGAEALEYPDGLAFSVVEVSSGEPVFTGTARRRDPPPGGERGRGDLTGAPVWELDFSPVDDPGRYRLCVEGIGCSFEVTIGADDTWLRAAVMLARGMYHQRSGTALGPPYTVIERPAAHADGAIEVHESRTVVLQDLNGPGDGPYFEVLRAGATAVPVPEAHGGHFDAGDWTRKVLHLWYARLAVELVELYPEVFGDLDLNIPESGDAVPDLIDEALWTVDLHRRMQGEDGSIRGAIDAGEDQRAGQTSWTDDRQWYAYSPDPWSGYLYAAAVAEVARVLERYDPERAAGYARSAVAAMEWASDQPVPPASAEPIRAQRAVAGASLYRLTGDERWHQAFRDSTELAGGPLDVVDCRSFELCEAAWVYARTDHDGVDPVLQAHARQTLVRNGDTIVAGSQATAYRWAMEHPKVPLVWGLGPSQPAVVGLLRAYHLTGDDRYLDTATAAASFSAGANPLGSTFVTGLGQRNPRYPLIVDVLNGGLPQWPGVPIYGLFDLGFSDESDWVPEFLLRPMGTHPDPEAVPYLWSWWDMGRFAGMNEFTVHQSFGPALYGFASLAAIER